MRIYNLNNLLNPLYPRLKNIITEVSHVAQLLSKLVTCQLHVELAKHEYHYGMLQRLLGQSPKKKLSVLGLITEEFFISFAGN